MVKFLKKILGKHKKAYFGLVQGILNSGVLLLVFLLPIFFLPVTTGSVEFDKQALVILVVGILVPICVLKSALKGKVRIVSSTVTNLLFLLLIFMGVSFAFSQARDASLMSVEGWAMLFGILAFFVAS